MARKDESKQIVVRKYGLLEPLNWDQDCADHLYLKNKLWNILVEIERDHRSTYREILESDKSVAKMSQRIQCIKDEIDGLNTLRNEVRKEYRSKKGKHTKHFDDNIKKLKAQVKELYPRATELRQEARYRKKTTLDKLELQRREVVKTAYQNSGLWWSNYNDVINSYNTARVCAMKQGKDLKFHRFDGSGGFRCQLNKGGVSVETLLSAQSNVAQVRMIDHDEFAELRGGVGKRNRQSYGSRNYNRDYGILSITVHTYKGAGGKTRRRMLDFPIVLHRPLPQEATLKELKVTRKRIGIDYRWDVTFIFSKTAVPVVHKSPKKCCGINFGWKSVRNGIRVATISDGESNLRHIVLPQIIMDKLVYIKKLRQQIDEMTNENYTWLLEHIDDQAPGCLAEAFATFKQSKRPHPEKFARIVELWKATADYLPDILEEADRRRKVCHHRAKEYHNLRDKIVRRREDFYRCCAKSIADSFGLVVLDKMDLRQLIALEKPNGNPTDLHKKARYSRSVAAVGVLREWIVKQAAKTGTIIKVVNIASTKTCHKCGKNAKPGSGHVWTCLECGSSWDQDENAAINLLKALNS